MNDNQPTMAPDTAAWIRDHVLPAAIRSNVLSAARGGTCACQWDICGACEQGRHDRCPYQTPQPTVETYLVNARGFVASAASEDDRADPAVWLADRICAYRCPCSSDHDQTVDEFPVRTLPGGPPVLPDPSHANQLALFALAGGDL